MTILVLLVMLMGQMLSHVGNTYGMAESNKERLQNMRAISDFIASELQTALLPINRTGTNSLQFVVNSSSVPSAYQSRDSLFWQTPLASDQTLGDVAEVGYFVKWGTTSSNQPIAMLCRFFVNPGTSVNGVVTPNSNFQIYTNPAAWLSQQILDAETPATEASGYQGLFAENVLGLWVQCLDSAGNPITQDASGKAFASNSFDSRRGYVDVSGTSYLPAVVDVSFAMIDAKSAKKMTASLKSSIVALVTSSPNAQSFVNSVNAGNSGLQVLRPGLRCFHRSIYLQNSK